MIRLRPLLQPVNWKYVLGEFILIVAGILIALWLNDWSQVRRDRQTELQLLREMRSALSEDLKDNQIDMEIFAQTRARLLRLQEHLVRRGSHTASADSLFGALIVTRTLQLNRGPYEVLSARGFEVISDDSLRTRVVHMYGTTYPFIETRYGRVNEFVREHSQPYFLRNFRGASRAGGPVTALSYSQVADDPYLMSLISWHLVDLSLIPPAYRQALDEGAALVKALDRHIKRLE